MGRIEDMKAVVEKILCFLARHIVRKYRPEVVGITGSVGKTSVKEIVVGILQHSFSVRGNLASCNNELGVPLTIIGAKSPGRSFLGWCAIFWQAICLLCVRRKDYPEILVLEMAANQPGDLTKLIKIASCHVAVITAVSPSHLKFFKTVKKVTQEKRILVSQLAKTDYAVLNRDDSEVFEMSKKTDADVITFGFHPESDVCTSDLTVKLSEDGKHWPEGMFFKIIFRGSIVPMYLSGIIGEHSVYRASAAIAVALVFGMNLVEISSALRDVTMPPGRMRLLPGIKNTLIIDDSYNASPLAMKAALETLSRVQITGNGERYSILGDMLELGQHTQNSHREVGLRVAEFGIDFLITVGEAMKDAAKAAREAGMPENSVASFNTAEEAGRFLQEKMQIGDTVLIKGSRAMHMEKIVKEVMAEPAKANELLVG